jgi:predicted phosphodiesterase
MAVAALYDIHGNLPALQAVLAEVEREDVDTILIGGDVANGPLPLATIERLMTLGDRARFVRGNGDREIVEAYDTEAEPELGAEVGATERIAAFAAARIERSHRDFLAAFEPVVELTIEDGGGGAVLFCHGTPDSDTAVITTATSDERLHSILRGVERELVVCGHTHRQFDRRADSVRVVNAGSVGMPYEGRRGAYWALIGSEVELRRTDYEWESALAEMRSGGLPEFDEVLHESLIEPMDPDEVAEMLEGMGA